MLNPYPVIPCPVKLQEVAIAIGCKHVLLSSPRGTRPFRHPWHSLDIPWPWWRVSDPSERYRALQCWSRGRNWESGRKVGETGLPFRQPQNISTYLKINSIYWFIMIYTSSTAQGGGGSFKNRKPIEEIGCCESRMAERIHWWTFLIFFLLSSFFFSALLFSSLLLSCLLFSSLLFSSLLWLFPSLLFICPYCRKFGF